jgi:hypothetical protein
MKSGNDWNGTVALQRISVVVVSYNVREHLSHCLESLLLGKRGEIYLQNGIHEIIVVDNNSSDGSADLVKKQYPMVELIENSENKGFGRAVNQGCAAATGDYLLILNPDSLVVGKGPQLMAEYMNCHPSIGVLGCRILNSDYSYQESARGFPDITTPFFGRTSIWSRIIPMNPLSSRNLPRVNELREPLAVDWVSGACMMISREVFNGFQGFHEGFFMYWEDADLCLRLKEAGYETVYFPDATVLHITGRSSAKFPFRSTLHFYRSAHLYYCRNMRPSGKLTSFVMDVLAAFGTVAIGSFDLCRHFFRFLFRSASGFFSAVTIPKKKGSLLVAPR